MTTDAIDQSQRFDRNDGLVRRRAIIDGRLLEVEVIDCGMPDDAAPLAWWRSYWSGGDVLAPKTDPSRGPVRVGELFSGAGGLMVGTARAARELGLRSESVFAADLDAEAVNIYARNHATLHPISRSVTELISYKVKGRGRSARFKRGPIVKPDGLIGFSGLEPHVGKVDVLLAGPPCQGYSQLNNHSLHDDTRNELYLTAPAVAVAMGVDHVVIENVLGVGRDPEGVVAQSIQLLEDSGYHVAEPEVVRADDLGWPQRRKRLLLVASRQSQPVPLGRVVDALRMEPPGALSAIEDLADRRDEHLSREIDIDQVTQERIDWLFDNDEYDLGLHMRPKSHRDGTTYTSVYGRMAPDQPAPTITTGFSTMGRGRFVHPTRRRTLTALEAARLQGFPDDYDWRFGGIDDVPWNKLTKWIGDAVPMPIGMVGALSVLIPTVEN